MPTVLHKLIVKNFKQFDELEIELGNTVVFVGPNNSGKTSALQALSLWHIGVQKWLASRGDKKTRTRVPINRKDLFSIPNTTARMLWRNLITHQPKSKKDAFDITIILEGITHNQLWRCGMEFRFDNDEVLYCQPLKDQDPMIPDQAQHIRMAFLPIMAGLSVVEPRVDRDYIEMMIGEGQTAQVLRNMCFLVSQTPHWQALVDTIHQLFGITLHPPILERGTIVMTYQTRDGIVLDLLASGSGMRQILLILAQLYLNPNVILLLDEPDAHLEILRQRQIYDLINRIASQQESQIIIATHSEIILTEAAKKDIVIAFVGKPHRMNQVAHIKRALDKLEFTDYYQAERKGWVLYLEGETDLAILQRLAHKLNHPVLASLEQPYVVYIRTDSPADKITNHFYPLQKEAIPHLIGILIMDNPPNSHKLDDKPYFRQLRWKRREIENYIARPEALLAYANDNRAVMNHLLTRRISPDALDNFEDTWWYETKMSDFLERLFHDYFSELGLPNLIHKSNYHILADYLTGDQIHPEIIEKLDAIYEIAQRATPRV